MHESKVGEHILRFEPPDLAHVILSGDVSVRDMEGIGAYLRAHRAKGSHILAMVDLAAMGNVPPEARRTAAVDKINPLYRGMALYNANFRTRVLAKLLLGAMRLLSAEKTPIAFFRTEDEARLWIEQRRSELAAARAQASVGAEYLTLQ